MKISKTIIENAAFCVFEFASTTPYWDYVNVYGKCYKCDGEKVADFVFKYASVQLEGASHKEGKAYAGIMSPFDMRTLKMVQSGCCPPGLVNEILESGPD